MIALLAALCFGVQGKSLLEQVVPKPTGKNGYEEYLRAVDVMSSGEARIYVQWRPGMSRELEARVRAQEVEGDPPDAAQLAALRLARRLEGLSLLDVRREAVGRYGAALEWVRQGNQKPVWDPREPMDFSKPMIEVLDYFGVLPEQLYFFHTARLAVADAYVKDADGQGSRATETVLQALAMAHKATLGTMWGVEVCMWQESVLLESFQERLPRLSQVDAKRTIAFIDDRLAQPLAVKAAFQNEAAKNLAFVAHPEHFDDMGRLFDSSDEHREMGQRLLRLSPTEKATLARSIRSRLEAVYSLILKRFDGPESEWVVPTPEPSSAVPTGTTLEDLSERLTTLEDAPYDNICIKAACLRTQFRLLRLAARVVVFRWEHDRLPPSLEDAAPTDEIADPLTGEKFQYKPMGDRFRVFSKGTPETGEIDIAGPVDEGTTVGRPHPNWPIRPMGPI